jgi:zinc protease
MPYDATGEYFRANTMNFSLGGAFNSRLNLNLRENKGYTYGIRSGFFGSHYPGVFEVSASVKRTATDSCVREIMKELHDYSSMGPNDDEVTFTKNSMLNSEALRYETSFQKARFLYTVIEYNLSREYRAEQAKIVQGMSKGDFSSLAKKYINPDKMVILVVGNKYLIKDKLEKLGYGKVKEVELQ